MFPTDQQFHDYFDGHDQKLTYLDAVTNKTSGDLARLKVAKRGANKLLAEFKEAIEESNYIPSAATNIMAVQVRLKWAD